MKVFNLKISIVLFSLLNSSLFTQAQSLKIIDSISQETLPFATIKIDSENILMIGNNEGLISIEGMINNLVSNKPQLLIISYTGYKNYLLNSNQYLNAKKTDTFLIKLILHNNELPPVIYTPPNIDSLLIHSSVNTLNKVFGNRNIQTFSKRIYIQKKEAEPVEIIESTGEWYSNCITPQLIVGSRNEHAITKNNQIRSLEVKKDQTSFSNIAHTNLWIDYDLFYYLPFSPQYFKKKLERIYDENGDIKFYKITMTPNNYKALSLLRFADNKLTISYNSLLNTERFFYINLEDTTINQLSVRNLQKSNFSQNKVKFEELERQVNYYFNKTTSDGLYIAFAQKLTLIKNKSTRGLFKIEEKLWLNTPENINNLTIQEITKRSQIRINEWTSKRDNKKYLSFYQQLNKPLENNAEYWKNVKLPDYKTFYIKYLPFSASPNFHLFIN